MKRQRLGRLNASAVGAALLGLSFLAFLPDAPVADAAARGDAEAVRALLERGEDPNASQGDGMTALHWAARHGHGEMVSLLLESGAHVDAVTRLGAYTPLHLAAETGKGEAVAMLVENGAPVDAVTSTGVTALHFASAAGSVEGVQALLAAGADVNRVDAAEDRTALMFAAGRGRADVMRVLIDHGAEVNAMTRVVDFQAQSEQDGVERRERAERIKAEKEAAEKAAGTWVQPEEEAKIVVDPDDPDIQVAVTAADDEEEDEEAEDEEEEGDEEEDVRARESTAQALGYDDLVGKQGGMTALHYAVRDGRRDEAMLLLENGADLNQVSGGDQSSPLLVAVINGNYDLAVELLEMGADPNLASEDGVAPLYAVLNNRWAPKALYPQPTAFKQQETGYLEVMRALLEAGADPDRRVNTHIWYTSYNFDLLGVNFSGATAFWRAAYGTDVRAMRLLKEFGADHTIPTRVVPQRRFRRGGDPEEDPSGLPPAEIGGPAVFPIHATTGVGYGVARAGNSHRHVHDGWLAATRYLVEELGVDVNQRDHDGYSAVHHAAARGDDELIRYLVEKGADVTFVSRRGQTTVDMANGPQQRVQPFPSTIALLEGLGAVNNHNCVSC